MVVYSKSRVDIAVTAHAVKHISDGPRPKLWHSLLQIKAAHFEASSQKTCIFKIDGKNLPGFGMNVTPDIVALRVDRGTVECSRNRFVDRVSFQRPDASNRATPGCNRLAADNRGC